MPYIDERARSLYDVPISDLRPPTPGDLNYVLTRIVDQYAKQFPGLGYRRIAEVTGVLENVKQEFYRRVAAPYEDRKAEENGDVYR